MAEVLEEFESVTKWVGLCVSKGKTVSLKVQIALEEWKEQWFRRL